MSFDDSYDAYLSAMGTPGMVLGMIKGMAEFITVKAPVEEDGEWVWNVKSGTDMNRSPNSFKMFHLNFDFFI